MFKKKKQQQQKTHRFILLYLENYNLSTLKTIFLFTSESHMLLNACGSRMLHLSSHIGTYPGLNGLEARIKSEQKTKQSYITNLCLHLF